MINFCSLYIFRRIRCKYKQSKLPSRVLLILSLKLFAEFQNIIKLEPVDTGNAEKKSQLSTSSFYFSNDLMRLLNVVYICRLHA